MEKHIYLFPNLGADFRIFQRLKIEGVETHAIHCVPPLSGESIRDYCERLKVQIGHKRPIFLGGSFGGILAIELAQLMDVEQIILVASIKSALEKPLDMRFFQKLPLYRLISADSVKSFVKLGSRFFSMEDATGFDLYKTMLLDTDDDFLMWGMQQVVQWKRETPPPNIVHIQGDRDEIFPHKYLQEPFHLIEGGRHFMVYDRAEEISALISDILREQAV